jgi:hypothetical protein
LSREFHSSTLRQSANNRFTESGNDAGSVRDGKESNMINKLLGAAAMAAMIYPTVPASAANVAGCNGGNLEKTESAVDVMADGAGKIVAQKEMAQAQDALLAGKMGACAMHLSRAMHPGTMTQAQHAGTMAQAPAETAYRAPTQSQWNWKPIQVAQ